MIAAYLEQRLQGNDRDEARKCRAMLKAPHVATSGGSPLGIELAALRGGPREVFIVFRLPGVKRIKALPAIRLRVTDRLCEIARVTAEVWRPAPLRTKTGHAPKRPGPARRVVIPEDWIAEHGREFDVMLSHPKLVSTGLDLFSKVQGGHNYATIVFYETGYNLFDMRQAARRAWRIGQPKDCKVYYLYYRETMQHRAMQLMSRKMAAAQALEGEFSAEGLAALAGEDNGPMALARSLAERIDEADMQRTWTKV